MHVINTQNYHMVILLQPRLSYILHENKGSEGSGRPGRCDQALWLCNVVTRGIKQLQACTS